ncbi:MAG TPA: flagellar export chaperone FliS [Acidobacteriaceae bacterium]|nr:flagellar export chaperone FliS [Acidobacteriaceae bacterium]
METAYQQQALRSANGIELIIALYDGAIRFLYRAAQCVDEHDEIGRRAAVKRAIDILMYLQARLRTDVGGEPAAALADFYTGMFTMTLEASHAASRRQFERVIACVRNVREAWLVVARDPNAQQMVPRDMRSQEERYSGSAFAPHRSYAQEDAAPSRWSA